jgi:hypothetical protein
LQTKHQGCLKQKRRPSTIYGKDFFSPIVVPGFLEKQGYQEQCASKKENVGYVAN